MHLETEENIPQEPLSGCVAAESNSGLFAEVMSQALARRGARPPRNGRTAFDNGRRSGAPGTIRTSDPQIRRETEGLFSGLFIPCHFVSQHAVNIDDFPQIIHHDVSGGFFRFRLSVPHMCPKSTLSLFL
jgi:hypothetical protein